VTASWKGVYGKEVAGEVDRRMKQGRPREKDKGVQASTPQLQVTVSPAGTQTEEVERMEKGKEKRRERGAKVEEEDEVMKDELDDTRIDWRLYEDLSSYEDEGEAPVHGTTHQNTDRTMSGGKKTGWQKFPANKDSPRGHPFWLYPRQGDGDPRGPLP